MPSPTLTAECLPTDQARRPVRVCFLIDRLARGGTETQLVELVRRMDPARVEPVLCLLNGDDESSRALAPNECPVVQLGVPSLLRPATVQKLFRFVRWLKEQQIGALQVHFLDSTYFGIIAARLAGIPVVRTRRNVGYWLTPRHRLLGRTATRFAAYTITNCEAVRQACIEQERARADSVVVFPNGIDTARFANVPDLDAQWGTRLPTVGTIANLRGVKGLDTLIEAARIVCRTVPETRFVVAGEGEERARLEQRIASAGLSGRFELPGATDNAPAFLAGVDVAAMCSQSEGLSNSLLEYMAAGRAIVATAVGGNVELIRDGENGLLVQPGDAQRLADAILRLLSHRCLAVEQGRAARTEVTERFSWPAVVRQVEDFYSDIVCTPRGAAGGSISGNHRRVP